MEKFCPAGGNPYQFPNAWMRKSGGTSYAWGVMMNTGKSLLALVMRYAPTRSSPLITSLYDVAMTMANLIEQAATFPQYTASGSKSTLGIILSPLPTSRAFFVPSFLTLNSHIIGTRCCPVKGTMLKHELTSNFVSSVSIALAHGGSFNLGTPASGSVCI